VASWDEGFYLIDPLSKRMKRYYAQEKSPNSVYFRVNAAHFSQRGLWMGDSEGSLYRFDFEQEKIVLLKNGLTSSSITAIYRGAGTKLWVGTYGEGLWCYDVATQQINPINLSQGTAPASQKHINTLVEDAQHHLWVGTNGGLFQIEAHTGRIHFYSSRNGLASNVVHGIVATAKSELWLSTNDGICRFNPTNKTCRNYNVQDGLHGKEFMPNALHQAADGRIFFGGLHGVNFFHPDSLREDATLPEVYLSKLLLPNRKIKPNQLHKPIEQNIQDRQSLRLSYAQAASLTFEYVGLYFKKTKRCTYAYKLEGFDRNWNTVGYQRSATYTNLNPGVYRFWVKAANSDGVWNPKASSIELRILPPWYLSNWAFGAYFTLFVLSLLVYRNYVRSREALKARLRLKELEAENLQELDQLKTNFFTNISHELRTPLTLILDPVEELIKTPQLPSKRVHEWYSTIQFNAQSLLRLINQLLDLSKLDAQRYLLHLSYSDVVDHCAKVVHLFDYPFEKRRVELIFDADPQSLFGWFDADALEKILNNLISNALKATPAKGKVSVSLTGINPRQGEAEILQIRVEDTGVGIPPEQLPQVFQRFFQTSTTRQSGQSSTGIGLALTAELVRLHRGEVNIESEPGVGTRFVVQIPLRAEVYPAEWRLPENQEPDATELEHPALLPPVYQHDPLQERQHLHLHDKVVLVAEDNAEMQNYLRYKLTDHYTVHTVANGREALHCALKKVPDLIISDLMMPEMDGIELCRAVKENEKTSHIPVILLTSRSVVESQLDGLKSGADDYLTKPFKSEILLARIENLLEQRQKLRERYMQAAQNSSITIPDIPIADTDSQFLQKVIAIIDTNLSNSSFNVDELERALNMSEMQLYRKLSSLTSMGGNAFIRHIRLKRASQLLEASNLSVGEIAYKVGFNSHSYFSKIYKREFGEPPTLKKK
jgi:signal transduction histidine kinase/DNA-binding response OmpR family regulator/streptogramin lyase